MKKLFLIFSCFTSLLVSAQKKIVVARDGSGDFKTVQEAFGIALNDAKVLKAETLASTAFINNGKGNFTAKPLPLIMQLSPVSAFSLITTNSTSMLISGGNFYGVLPYEGRYDAMPLTFCTNNKGSFTQPQLLPPSLNIKGEVRDVQSIKLANKNSLIIARNHDSLIFLSY